MQLLIGERYLAASTGKCDQPSGVFWMIHEDLAEPEVLSMALRRLREAKEQTRTYEWSWASLVMTTSRSLD
jgi:hypothetical protein